MRRFTTESHTLRGVLWGYGGWRSYFTLSIARTIRTAPETRTCGSHQIQGKMTWMQWARRQLTGTELKIHSSPYFPPRSCADAFRIGIRYLGHNNFQASSIADMFVEEECAFYQ
ncbi:hypothetical protein GDO78_017968 [Eleutherodactylus coqui]|uniref:Uncharacterized protein n=1 Tax=Eleutherodactylus coqui TaxID=57060 RepID=A0A8J6BIF3_ELECQ|nr:hypothetical protein GDO78_017968 [Eleutherodactylus coqui]